MRCLPLIVFAASVFVSFAAEPLPRPEDLVDLTGRVRVLLERKCHECHGEHLLKPEGRFGHVLDLKRIADNPDYIVRGDPAKSEFFRLLKDGEMPPDDQTKFAKLNPAELDSVRRWIAAGAPEKLPAVLPRPPTTGHLAAIPHADAVAARERARQKLVTIAAKNRPTGEVVAEIEKRSGIKIEYVKPAPEPLATINLKDGTVFEALHYLALRGNFALTFTTGDPRLGPNPPAELPPEIAPLVYAPLAVPGAATVPPPPPGPHVVPAPGAKPPGKR